ncbi:MAG: dihydrodipicolinate synthase family protein [Candidatus Latescibacteria bacterium]|nr:dihydrodipicolinate synthase family protein [Candidatus Latescibacterota bacterium]HJP28969.1 dihydrodipicolinate synthase family protein [Candidatus Latescibacterota bacterium]
MRALTHADCADVLVVAITPRRTNGDVDLDGVHRNVSHLVNNGVRFLMPMCGTGLVYDATMAEFEQVTAAFVDAAGEALVVPGIGPGYGRSLEMARIARGLGVAGAMVMPIVGPASAPGSHEGLRRISDLAGLPIVLYQRRLDIMPVESVVELCALESVVGLKYAVDDVDSFRQIVAGAGQTCAMVCGMAEDPSITYLQSGAVGFSSGMANFLPRMSLSLLSAFRRRDLAEAERLRALMVPFEDFRAENGARYSASLLHAAMDYAGLVGGPVVPFAEDVAAADLPRVHEMMDALLAEEGLLSAPMATTAGGVA